MASKSVRTKNLKTKRESSVVTDNKAKKKKQRKAIDKQVKSLNLSDEPKLQGDTPKLKNKHKLNKRAVYDAGMAADTVKNLATASMDSDNEKDIGNEVIDSAEKVAGRNLVPEAGKKDSRKKSKLSFSKSEKGKDVKDSKPSGKLSFSSKEKAGEIAGDKVKENTGTGEIIKPGATKRSRLSFESRVRDEANLPKDARKKTTKAVQKRQLKREYAKAKTAADKGKSIGTASSKAVRGAAGKVKEVALNLIKHNTGAIVALLFIGLMAVAVLSVATTLSGALSSAGGAFVSSTYLGSDDEITATNNAYEEKERQLQAQIDNIESTYPGYDEYRYQVDEISHDPFALASYLTVKYQSYKKADVESEIDRLFREQFELTLNATQEIRQRQVIEVDDTVSTEDYTVNILEVTLKNKGLDMPIGNSLNAEALALYRAYQATCGNRPYLFEGYISSSGTGGGMSYDIPPEALSDIRFKNMIDEAKKYLGYPYVWGGDRPSTSFDCSGFVSYVINNCGNGWNIGRNSAESLRGLCTFVSPSQAKPGDLIFFEKTYNTPGASHVGIYVGDGMMIHCGNPIQFASIETNYWKNHFLCFGRL